MTDRHPEKLGCGSLLEKNRNTLEISPLYCIELNREAGLLRIGEQRGEAHALWLNKETGLASFRGSSLQAVNSRGEKATVDTFCTCSQYPHTDQNSRLHPVPLSLTPGEKAVPFLHGFETLGSSAELIPDQQHTGFSPHKAPSTAVFIYTYQHVPCPPRTVRATHSLVYEHCTYVINKNVFEMA